MPQEKLDPASFSPDTREFLALLDRHRVRYLMVGGEAVIYYGHARLTGDVDFFYDPTAANVRHLYDALNAFWDGQIPGLTEAAELMEPDLVLQFGMPPNRIDLINTIDGVQFDAAWANRLTLSLDMPSANVNVQVIGLADLIRNKEASGRPKDMEDLKFLRSVRKPGTIS